MIERWYEVTCDHCSLEELCDKGNFEVGMCVDLFDGSGRSRFVKI